MSLCEIFNEQSFYQQFASDLRDAKALVLIQSPFISKWRLDKLQTSFEECIARNVRVCVFIQDPVSSESNEQKQSVEQGAARLTSIGVHVNLRKSIHEKLAIVDEHIFWDGSLNILSQRKSRERMTRWIDRPTVFRAIVAHELNRCDICVQQRISANLTTNTDDESLQLMMIGKLLRDRRNLLGLSQKDLAGAIGLPQSAVSRIESGHKSTRVGEVLRLCSQLDLTLRPIPWYGLSTLDSLFFAHGSSVYSSNLDSSKKFETA